LTQNKEHELGGGLSPLIVVIDDEESVRDAIAGLLKSKRFRAHAFESAERFLSSSDVSATACLILDVRMPGMDGLELQRELTARGRTLPVIFITAQADEGVRARAMQEGAIDFLFKPFTDEALLAAVGAALEAV
jgi:FixJ family two-component response regulator